MVADVLEALRDKGEHGDADVEADVRRRVRALCERFPIYGGCPMAKPGIETLLGDTVEDIKAMGQEGMDHPSKLGSETFRVRVGRYWWYKVGAVSVKQTH